ncbi:MULTISPECIES: DUF547 domain-containing protein [unclassified Pseudoalteromonas]|mgnify:FL=1|uniref:DUF547 domain-containing protein n=1 Tax=unclassified Pseudoalteromonas TaxID=194690 RepID=UPI001407E00A|nr:MULTISPECIES: DUF547 domain-containing protein [unclassified Pseudoalteromonas]MBC7009225.1 DUF547 domain-containing protein [Pseudoalteromonas sp. BZK2]MED5511460.1 DUF547 domain-containing protein [Pseudomonadota bacterium]NHH89023.1 hypothetical protein [Pseudoalteromonas sp. MB47]
MIKQLLLIAFTFCSLSSYAKINELPEEFSDFSLNRDIRISYEDLDNLLEITVLDMGRSDRSSRKSQSSIGTRMKSHKNNDTALEANRFLFEAVSKSEIKDGFHKIRISLEKVPDEISLNELSLDEQLAYWLNLYNTAIVEKLIEHYPIRDTEDLLFDDDSILDEEFLTVAGYKLSLNDIQHKIVFEKFGKKKPIVMYGFYQGNIGSPNLRNEAYKGNKVYHQLVENGEEFVNSNRGMQIKRKSRLYVSKYYEQTESLFTDFETDLREHLEDYAEGQMKSDVKYAKRFKIDIEDWNITDLFGTERSFGATASTNPAAMLNAVVSNSDVPVSEDGSSSGMGAVNVNFINDSIMMRTMDFGRFSPEMLEKIKKLNLKRQDNSGTVEIKDIDSNN